MHSGTSWRVEDATHGNLISREQIAVTSRAYAVLLIKRKRTMCVFICRVCYMRGVHMHWRWSIRTWPVHGLGR